jgi:hypothetical protein
MPHQHDQQDGRGPADELAEQLDDVTGALEGLSQTLEAEEELPVVLQRCCWQAVHAIPGADLATITLLREAGAGAGMDTAASTDEHASDLDHVQIEAGTGPCLDAAKTGQVVRVSVHAAHADWPRFAQAASDAGIGSVLSAPLFINADYQGSLNLYGQDGDGFRKLDAKLLEVYTAAAEAALRVDRRYRTARDHAGQLHTALGSRAVIDQAKGVIMAVRHVDADAAFAVLVEQSQRENRKLREVATSFIARVTGLDSSITDA